MSNDQTQHQKLDKLLEITTVIRIEQGKVEVRLDNAKDERKDMKDDIKDNVKGIKENAKMKRLSNVWDGVNSFLIGLGTYLGMKY